ncbi:hypothetical protein CBER1_11764 [Cercospora berteroae]|uniref:Uncharacterized protein n=1 Tax=Cercospora berteroae TaxID=357750 RepID=A0A2S6CIN5_9PEZI|nr:hypothetical protein CBER1_11764 [Cercospora berteroae]
MQGITLIAEEAAAGTNNLNIESKEIVEVLEVAANRRQIEVGSGDDFGNQINKAKEAKKVPAYVGQPEFKHREKSSRRNRASLKDVNGQKGEPSIGTNAMIKNAISQISIMDLCQLSPNFRDDLKQYVCTPRVKRDTRSSKSAYEAGGPDMDNSATFFAEFPRQAQYANEGPQLQSEPLQQP